MHNAKTLREIEVIDGAFAIRQDKKDPSNSCLGRLFIWDPRFSPHPPTFGHDENGKVGK